MTIEKEKNKKILDFAYNFKKIIKAEKWVPRYDIDSDSLSFTVSRLPNDARLKYFDDEIALYWSKKNNIKGIFIEYFKSNFIKHHKDIKNLLKNIKQKDDDALIKLKKAEINKAIPEIEETIQESIAESLKFKPIAN